MHPRINQLFAGCVHDVWLALSIEAPRLPEKRSHTCLRAAARRNRGEVEARARARARPVAESARTKATTRPTSCAQS